MRPFRFGRKRNSTRKALAMAREHNAEVRETAARDYRERARELRARGRRSRHEQLARSFLAIAEAYELLADSALTGIFADSGKEDLSARARSN